MTDVDASDRVPAAAAGEQPAAGREVTASQLTANQRLYEEALACIEDAYRRWQTPPREPVESAATAATAEPPEPADGDARGRIADPARSSPPAPSEGCEEPPLTGTNKIYLRTFRPLTPRTEPRPDSDAGSSPEQPEVDPDHPQINPSAASAGRRPRWLARRGNAPTLP